MQSITGQILSRQMRQAKIKHDLSERLIRHYDDFKIKPYDRKTALIEAELRRRKDLAFIQDIKSLCCQYENDEFIISQLKPHQEPVKQSIESVKEMPEN